MIRRSRHVFQAFFVMALTIASAASANRHPTPASLPEIPVGEDALASGRPEAPDAGLQVFTSAGHAVGFDEAGYTVAALDHALRVRFVGARPVRPQAASTPTEAAGKTAPLDHVSYRQLWPGIDLDYDAGGGILRSTYQVAPGANPGLIELAYNVPISVARDGSLGVNFEQGTLRESAPIAWQIVDGERVPVAVAFADRGQDRLGFALGEYNPDIALTIDPTLSWHTFLGGSGTDRAYTLALDGAGNLFLAGGSRGSWGTPLSPFSGDYDMLVVKLDAAGRLHWHTFLGGSDHDAAAALALDSASNLFVAGGSDRSWATPLNPHSGAHDMYDMVVAKLSSVDSAPGRLVVSPNDGYQVLVDSGQGLPTPVSRTYVLGNPGGTAFDYQVSTTAFWLDISPAQGRLEAGGEASVTVSANAQVNTLAPNELHQTEVRFDNLSDGTGNTVRTASAFVLAGAGTGWGISSTEGFDDSGSLAAENVPVNTTAELKIVVAGPETQQVGIAAAPIPNLNFSFQQRRRDMGPEDNLTAWINGQQVRQWFGDSDWERGTVPLATCPGVPCEITFAFQERPDRSDASGAAYLDNLGIAPDVQAYASVLPGSRSAQIGQSVTGFATMINAGAAVGEDCALRPITPVPGQFNYQTTDPATNALVGVANIPRDIPAGAAQSFVFAFTPDAAMAPTDVELRFDCSNSGPADVVIGLNTFLLSASAQLVPDVVALAATISDNGGGGNGIVDIPGTNGTGVFAVASVNVGSGGAIQVAADTGGIELPVRLLLCETDPVAGACLEAPNSEVTTDIAANATPTFGIFVEGTGQVGFNPAAQRVFVRFRDQTGVVRGATSVAVRTQQRRFAACLPSVSGTGGCFRYLALALGDLKPLGLRVLVAGFTDLLCAHGHSSSAAHDPGLIPEAHEDAVSARIERDGRGCSHEHSEGWCRVRRYAGADRSGWIAKADPALGVCLTDAQVNRQ